MAPFGAFRGRGGGFRLDQERGVVAPFASRVGVAWTLLETAKVMMIGEKV